LDPDEEVMTNLDPGRLEKTSDSNRQGTGQGILLGRESVELANLNNNNPYENMPMYVSYALG
jgi:hypothetical protein